MDHVGFGVRSGVPDRLHPNALCEVAKTALAERLINPFVKPLHTPREGRRLNIDALLQAASEHHGQRGQWDDDFPVPRPV